MLPRLTLLYICCNLEKLKPANQMNDMKTDSVTDISISDLNDILAVKSKNQKPYKHI